VVDGKIGFTGAVGFAGQWSEHALDKNHWRDTHMRIEGPLVAELQASFQEHWVKTFQEALSGADQFPELPASGDLKAQVVPSRSFSMAPIPLVQAVAFTAAEKRIWITNAYCTPTKDQVEQLVKAVQRGVDVRLLLPGPNNDQPMTKSAGRAAMAKCWKAASEFRIPADHDHEKSMVIDGLFSMLGSSISIPVHPRSTKNSAWSFDQSFGRKMGRCSKDLAQSRNTRSKSLKPISLGAHHQIANAPVPLATRRQSSAWGRTAKLCRSVPPNKCSSIGRRGLCFCFLHVAVQTVNVSEQEKIVRLAKPCARSVSSS
jgi:hypothetical protein